LLFEIPELLRQLGGQINLLFHAADHDANGLVRMDALRGDEREREKNKQHGKFSQGHTRLQYIVKRRSEGTVSPTMASVPFNQLSTPV